MVTRRWKAGMAGDCGGIPWRIVPGRKGPGDLRLELFANGQWLAVKMDLGFLMADFFFENEELLHPPAKGNLGGSMYTGHCLMAIAHGWETARQWLAVQRERAAARREAAEAGT